MVALLAVAPLYLYPMFVMQALCFALFACAFNLLIGYGGLLSFGHALYFGWASYRRRASRQGRRHQLSVLVGSATWHWVTIALPPLPPELAILAGTLAGAVLGLVAGLLAIRRQGIYFAMITLALAQMMFFFALQAKFTGGEDGIQGVPRGKLFGVDRSGRSRQHVRHRGADLPARLPADLPHHPFAVRRGAEGDPRERAARDLARLQDRPLQAPGLRAVGDARRASPARPRRSCCRSPRSPTSTGRCRARWC